MSCQPANCVTGLRESNEGDRLRRGGHVNRRAGDGSTSGSGLRSYRLDGVEPLLLGGRAADLLGRRRVFYVGVMLFTFASFLCGLAWSEPVLIGARALQGLGAAIISPAALSIITTSFAEGRERHKALWVEGSVGRAGWAVGRCGVRRPRGTASGWSGCEAG